MAGTRRRASCIGAVVMLVCASFAGARAAPAQPRVTFEPPSPRLGDLVVVEVRAPGSTAGSSSGEPVLHAFFCQHPLVPVSGGWRGFIAVPTDTSTGTHVVEVRGIDREAPPLRARLRVRARAFETTELRVAPRFTREKSPQLKARLAREQSRFDAVWSGSATRWRARGPADAPARLPTEGRRTGRFGTRRTFNGTVKSAHYGLDLSAPPGRPVGAAWPGAVALTGHMWGSGKTVVLDHGAGVFSLYFHLRRIAVEPGAEVAAGQQIGRVGQTGRVTGPHLHFAVAVQCRADRGDGEPRSMYVDPEPLLAR
jgi:murein DD-endopeptidase MepM/ murein hydrolase activator NlpD